VANDESRLILGGRQAVADVSPTEFLRRSEHYGSPHFIGESRKRPVQLPPAAEDGKTEKSCKPGPKRERDRPLFSGAVVEA
jgi:hypothetical protein